MIFSEKFPFYLLYFIILGILFNYLFDDLYIKFFIFVYVFDLFQIGLSNFFTVFIVEVVVQD